MILISGALFLVLAMGVAGVISQASGRGSAGRLGTSVFSGAGKSCKMGRGLKVSAIKLNHPSLPFELSRVLKYNFKSNQNAFQTIHTINPRCDPATWQRFEAAGLTVFEI